MYGKLWLHGTIAAKGLVYIDALVHRKWEPEGSGLRQRRGADAVGSANNFLMILLGLTPMAWATFTNSNGNRANVTNSTGDGNRLLTDGTYNYTYDAAGNRIARTDIATGQVTLYQWNNANELTAVISGGTEVAYAYNALGQMVSRTPTGIAGEQTEYYVYDGQNLALVLNAAGQVVERED